MSGSNLQTNREILANAHAKGPVSTLFAFFKLSGPGWLQSAITLGGGSLGGALYLGILCGTSMLWLQLVAIVIGVVMLSAIAYVTLSTGKRPYAAINEYVNPVLGVGWVAATILANMIWIMPQFSLCFSSLETANIGEARLPDTQQAKMIASGIIGGLAFLIVLMSFWPGWMSRIFDWLLKLLVGFVVLCFVAVVVLLVADGAIDWNAILTGFIPNWNHWNTVSPELQAVMSEMPASTQGYWTDQVLAGQRKSMIGVTATAVGLNMTFLLPYSMLARGWDRPFRGLARFDLITGLAIPFVIVTSCIVIASAHAFHAKADAAFLSSDPNTIQTSDFFESSVPILERRYRESLREDIALAHAELETAERFSRLEDFARGNYEKPEDIGEEKIEAEYFNSLADKSFADWKASSDKAARQQKMAEFASTLSGNERIMAATLIKPNVGQLAKSLEPLLGENNANLVFGLGALAMGFSTIIILMIINGYAFAEIAGQYNSIFVRSVGALAAAAVGFFWWDFWDGESKTWLIILASTFGAILLPIAYIAFFALMNSSRLLGNDKPRGIRWLIWNILMFIGVAGAIIQAVAAVVQLDDTPARPYVYGALILFLVLAAIGFSGRRRQTEATANA